MPPGLAWEHVHSPEVPICMARPQQHELAALFKCTEDAVSDEVDALLRDQPGHADHQGLLGFNIQP